MGQVWPMLDFVKLFGHSVGRPGPLCVKLLEWYVLLLGLDSPTRIDIVQLEAEHQPWS